TRGGSGGAARGRARPDYACEGGLRPRGRCGATADGGVGGGASARPLPLAGVGRSSEAPQRAFRVGFPVAEPIGTDPRLREAAVVPFAEGVEDLLGGDRRLVEAHPDRVIDRVGDRRNDRIERTFTGLFGTERAFRVDALHD